ncbi:MAG: DNA repair protein RecN [Muribaculaceae bacterium]|nr:DNA repair protein RecN [Muribaculaceae bacterium]
MIKQLHISNYALIDKLDIGFADGLTIITGETGAGKSIILGALSLILGERADTKAIRDTSSKTIVEATFGIKGYQLEHFFKDNDIDWDDQECLVRRELSPTGRSRAFINDTPVALTVLRELSTRLLDIHSQHSNMLLSQPAFQLSVLDNIADNSALLNDYRKAYQEFREATRMLDETSRAIEQLRRNEDYIRFQLDQLQAMQLQPDEDQELEVLQNKLSNITELKEGLWNVENNLNSDENSILERLNDVALRLEAAEPNLVEVAGMSARVRSSLIELKDIAQSISTIVDTLNDDPAELARVDERLNNIYSLQRKHNAQNVNQLIDIQHDYERQLGEIEHNDDIIEELKLRVATTQAAAREIASQLSSKRREAARCFNTELLALATPLGMKNISFEVAFNETGLTPSGTDAVEFMMAFNKNQRPMPVKDTASGGEISRVMLCIKTIIARHVLLPSIIFDEVDTGVSGDVANMIGEMMSDISQSIQVIAITHLPQVAANGDHHLRVFKTDTDVETLTRVEQLDEEEHVMEIARMLSGKDLNQAAIDNAKSLIKHQRTHFKK